MPGRKVAQSVKLTTNHFFFCLLIHATYPVSAFLVKTVPAFLVWQFYRFLIMKKTEVAKLNSNLKSSALNAFF